jgi:hypothetical protein
VGLHLLDELAVALLGLVLDEDREVERVLQRELGEVDLLHGCLRVARRSPPVAGPGTVTAAPPAVKSLRPERRRALAAAGSDTMEPA